MEIAQEIVDLFVNNSPHIRYAEAQRQGYLVLDVQADKTQSDWYLLDGVDENEGNETRDASWAVYDGEQHVVEMDSEESPVDEPSPLASCSASARDWLK